MKNTNIQSLHTAYVGQSFAAMGSDFRQMINFIGHKGGYISGNLSMANLVSMGLKKTKFHVFNLEFANHTAIALYEPLERVNQNDAHKITILGFYNEFGEIHGGREAYTERLSAIQQEFYKESFRRNSEILFAVAIKPPVKQLKLI